MILSSCEISIGLPCGWKSVASTGPLRKCAPDYVGKAKVESCKKDLGVSAKLNARGLEKLLSQSWAFNI